MLYIETIAIMWLILPISAYLITKFGATGFYRAQELRKQHEIKKQESGT